MTIEPCTCTPECPGRLVFGDLTEETAARFSALDERLSAYLALPKCELCKRPTPDEFLDPFFVEAGERICDDCGKPHRPGCHPHRRNRRVKT